MKKCILTLQVTLVSERLRLRKKLHVQGNLRLFSGGYPYIDIGVATNNYFRLIHDNPTDTFNIQKNGGTLITVAGGGNVGIGTTSPSQTFTVENNSGIFRINTSTSTYPRIEIGSASGTTAAIINRTTATQNILFGETSDTGNYLFRGGNVGIGTTSPDEKLVVNGNILISDTSNDKYFGSNVNLILNADADGNSGSSARNIIFQNRGSEKMRIDSSGNVGIGTTSPSQGNLVISPSAQSADLDGLVLAYNPDGAANRVRAQLKIDNFNGVLELKSGADVLTTKINSAGDSYFNNGNVGIGTTSPDFKLSLNGGMRIENTSPSPNTGSGTEYGYNTSANEAFQITRTKGVGTSTYRPFIHRAEYISFQTGTTSSTERMRITSAGVVKVNSGNLVGTGNGIHLSGARMNAIDNNGTTADNSSYLGYSSGRWIAVYAVSGTIQTSDVREKTEIKSTQLGLDFVNDLNPVSYKWIDGKRQSGEKTIKDKRQHQGLIAQEVTETLEKHGIDKNEFGGLDIQKTDKYNDFHGMSYEQFIAPMIKAIQELKAEIELLKTQINN